MISWRTVPFLLLATILSVPANAGEAPATVFDASGQHVKFLKAGDRATGSEWVSLAPETTGVLASLDMGARIELRQFPVAPGDSAEVMLERIDIYAPDARVIAVSDEGERDIPRSTKIRLIGHVVSDPAIRVGLWVEADGSSMRGMVSGPLGLQQIEHVGGKGPIYEVGAGAAERLGIDYSIRCDTEDHREPFARPEWAKTVPLPAPPPTVWKSRAATHSAVVLFDTDGELIDDMYGGSAAGAGEGIADWVTAANVIYERDPQLRLMQGNTILRENASTDPWTESTTSGQLTEFGDYYEDNMGAFDRVFAVFLSGKSSSPNSGSGRSWIDSYCEKQSYGGSYSVGMVLRALPLDHAINVSLMVHEIGHAAGSEHTHCYDPNIDECYNGQCGTGNCFCDTPSCPDHSAVLPISSGLGTLMSYCHFGTADGGADCGFNASYFHPTVIDRIRGRMLANVAPGCVESIEPTYPSVVVSKAGAGTGVVVSNPTGVYCGATCDVDFLPGITVVLSAVADPGSVFVGFSGGCTGLTCAFITTLSGEKAVTATFDVAPDIPGLIFADGFESGDTRRW